jgi:hypothetical protein
MTSDEIAALIRKRATEAGIEPVWMVAIATVESGLRPGVSVRTGRDGKRGGAFGLFQLTVRTLRGLGYKGDGWDLLEPETNIAWACKLMQANRPLSLEDAAALWNAGHVFDALPHTPGSTEAQRLKYRTRTVYVPAVLAAALRLG